MSHHHEGAAVWSNVFTLLSWLVSPEGVQRCAGAVPIQNVFQPQYVPQCTCSSQVSSGADKCRQHPHGHTVTIAIVVIIISCEILIAIIKCLSFVATLLLFALICLLQSVCQLI